jgi:hypothetical protein
MHAQSLANAEKKCLSTPSYDNFNCMILLEKEVLANDNKTRTTICHQDDRWMELKEALRV